MLSEGDRFPAFSLPDQDGNLVSNQDLMGSPCVIYFYPKDDTPGCTVEACEFRDLAPARAGTRVIGVSPDTPKSHTNFKKKFGLDFTLLADVGHKLAEDCGVWVEKMNYGKAYMGVERSTFLVDAEGRIKRIWRKVKAQGHAQEVLASLA